MQDQAEVAATALISVNPADTAAIGRLQAAVRHYRSFTSSEVMDVMKNEVKEATSARK